MKTQKKTLRGIVTSSILALTLAGGLMPAGALAFAADAAGQPINQDQAITEDAGSASTSANANANASDQAASDAAPAGAEEVADGLYKVDDATATEPARPQYTTNAQGHTSATLRLEGQAQPTAGTIEYGGLAYTIDPENPNTAKVTGLATDKPKGDVQVQTQVASDGKIYQVTAIEFAWGGGRSNCLF